MILNYDAVNIVNNIFFSCYLLTTNRNEKSETASNSKKDGQVIEIQSDLKGMVKELIYEVKYQSSARPGGP